MLPSLGSLAVSSNGAKRELGSSSSSGDAEPPSKEARNNTPEDTTAVRLELGVEEVQRPEGHPRNPHVAPLVHMVLALVSFVVIEGVDEWVKDSACERVFRLWCDLHSLVEGTLQTLPATSTRLGGNVCLDVVEEMLDDPKHVPDEETLTSLRGILSAYLAQRKIPPGTRPAKPIWNHLTLLAEYFTHETNLSTRTKFNKLVRAHTDASQPETSCVGLVSLREVAEASHVEIQGIVACPFLMAARRDGSVILSKGVGTSIMDFLLTKSKSIRVDPLQSAHAWIERLCGWGVHDLHGKRRELSHLDQKMAKRERQRVGVTS